jgi:hypothetical protein
MIPPDAPIEGTYTNLSNLLGQKVLIKECSKVSHFVSCKHMMAQLLSSILLYTSNLLSLSFKPLTFQQSTFQSTFIFEELFIETRKQRNNSEPCITGHKHKVPSP